MRFASWFKHLKEKRGSQFVKQMVRMWKFHRTSFEEITSNIFTALEPWEAKFTFPTVASVMPYYPHIIKDILHEGHEIANHGYKHVKYPNLSNREQELEFKQSVELFENYNIPIYGFRAPYNNYNEFTIELVEQYDFEWDGGIGYKPEFRTTNEMFYYQSEEQIITSFVSIPCHRYSDDLLIDHYRMQPEEMGKLLRSVIQKASKTGGVIMFDLHPIRIGQPKYVKILAELVEFAHGLNAWMPRVVDAIRTWKDKGGWPDQYDFCLLLTGDIDNFMFFDYFRRLI